jgi:SAM-dependent methyltransferase
MEYGDIAGGMTSRITVDQERNFYDSAYAAHLHTPDHALIINRHSLQKELSDPGGLFYERRLLYGAVLRQLLSEQLAGRAILDYGCGLGEWGVWMATEGAAVALVDLSPVAIEIGLRRAAASGVANRVRGFAVDAANLNCFQDAEFDLIYASAALHHTLKYSNALTELLRVLRPGGKLILAETYGNNTTLNWLRRLNWRLRKQAHEAGEDIILSDRELDLLRRHFRRLSITPMNLLAMSKRLFRGHFHSPLVRGAMQSLELADHALLTLVPWLRRHCGEVLVVAEK